MEVAGKNTSNGGGESQQEAYLKSERTGMTRPNVPEHFSPELTNITAL